MEDEWLLLDRSLLISVLPQGTSPSSSPNSHTEQTADAARKISDPSQHGTVDGLEKSPSDISLASIVENDSILVQVDSSSIPIDVCAEVLTLSHSHTLEDIMGPRLSATSAPGATPKLQSKSRGTLTGGDSSHQRHKSGSSCASAAAHRSKGDSASTAEAPQPESAPPNSTPTNTQSGPNARPPSTETTTSSVAHKSMPSFPLPKKETIPTAPNTPKQQSHAIPRLSADRTNAERCYVDAQLGRLWGHQSCGESLERPVRAQLLQTRMVSPLGRRVTELMSEHLASYQARYHELRQGAQAPSDAELDSDSALYHHYTALAATSSWHALLGRAEAALSADLLDLQMLHLERYLFLYGSYMFTDDGDLSLPRLHRDFWWEAAERKRRWERAFCAIPGNSPPTGLDCHFSSSPSSSSSPPGPAPPGPMPAKLRDLYQLLLEEDAPPHGCGYLPLWQYVSWDATRPGGPAAPAEVAGADDDATTAALQYSRRRALADLRMLARRLPPRYAALAPHLRVAIGAFLEANYHGFYEDCVTRDYCDYYCGQQQQQRRRRWRRRDCDCSCSDDHDVLLAVPTAGWSLGEGAGREDRRGGTLSSPPPWPTTTDGSGAMAAAGSVCHSAPESCGNANASSTGTAATCGGGGNAGAAASDVSTAAAAAAAAN